MRRLPSNQTNKIIRRERDHRALWRLALLLLSGVLLAGGFVFAAAQHFSALQYGYQREALRLERSRLLEEQHRLLLERESAASPDNLENAARGIGLQPVRPAQINKVRIQEIVTSRSIATLASPSGALHR